MKKHQLLVAIFASMALAGWSQEIVVESYADGTNSQAFSQVEGKWTESTAKSTAPGLKATKALFNDANTDPAAARFTPEIPADGKYEVFITYPTSGNASDIKYTVVSADGTKELSITQNGRDFGAVPAANQWYSLGVYNFKAGTSGYVEVRDPLTGNHPLANEPNARIYADAVKFVADGNGATVAAPEAATPATEVAAAVTPAPGLPELPGATTPAAQADMPGLPAVQAAATTPAIPALPPTTSESDAAAQLPGLPAGTPTVSAATELPALPGSTPTTPDATTAMPALPAAPATGVAQDLPALPPSTEASAPGLPDLPAAQPAPETGSTVAVTAQATPYQVPDLPSLAPVTPTPQRTLPSPADTPVAGRIAGLPNGALSNLPPTPALPPMSTPSAAFAVPTPFAAPTAGMAPATGAPAVPGAPVAATPAPGKYSITSYNPSNLQWMYDFGAALNTARSQNKNVMIFFTAEGNKAGQTYETQYFMHPTVRQALDKYVLVKVDFAKNTRLAYSLGVFGAGVIVVADASGDVTSRVVQLPPTPVDLLKQMAGAKPATAPGAPGAPGAMGASTTGTQIQ